MTRPRDSNLDLLRAIAILGVLAFHLPLPNVSWVFFFIKSQGWLGVDLFFVLSGYLVGGIYFRELAASGKVSLFRFWRRRWLRTIPPYVGLLAVFSISNFIRHTGKSVDWYYFIFLQNYWSNPIAKMPFSWSLCVEEHFYFLFPLLALLISRFRKQAQFLLILGLALSLLSRLFAFGNIQNTHMRLDGLIYGVWIAYLQTFDSRLFASIQAYARKCLPYLLVLFFLLPWVWPTKLSQARLTVSAAFFGIWLCAWAGRPALKLARSKLVFWIATTSYSAYLIHGYGYETARILTHNSASWLSAPVYFGFAALFTLCFYSIVEKIGLKSRDWIESRLAESYHKTFPLSPGPSAVFIRTESEPK